MERISIRNFGPIGEAEIEIKDINVFIGTTSSGKSTAAKLISIFKGSALREKPHFERFIKLLQDYNISFEIKENTRIRFEENGFYFEVSGETLHVRYILHRNSLEDFLLRNKLPVTEQQLVEQHSKFWKYLESLTH